jgi:hypothetical protein
VKLTLYTLAAAGLALFSIDASAQGVMKNDPRRPVADISRDLGVTTAQFVACFNDVSPAPQGTKATGERERSNKAILLPCLQQANPSITNQSLDAVMDKYRPEGRVAGN